MTALTFASGLLAAAGTEHTVTKIFLLNGNVINIEPGSLKLETGSVVANVVPAGSSSAVGTQIEIYNAAVAGFAR